MEEFIENFNEFREFLNSKVTECSVESLVGENGKSVLMMIRDKFEELGLNDAF